MTNSESKAQKVIVGVDTHKYVHIAVAIDTRGTRLGDHAFLANAGGYRALKTVWDVSSHRCALLILTFTVSPLSFTESSMMRTKVVSTRFPICTHSPTLGRLR